MFDLYEYEEDALRFYIVKAAETRRDWQISKPVFTRGLNRDQIAMAHRRADLPEEEHEQHMREYPGALQLRTDQIDGVTITFVGSLNHHGPYREHSVVFRAAWPAKPGSDYGPIWEAYTLPAVRLFRQYATYVKWSINRNLPFDEWQNGR